TVTRRCGESLKKEYPASIASRPYPVTLCSPVFLVYPQGGLKDVRLRDRACGLQLHSSARCALATTDAGVERERRWRQSSYRHDPRRQGPGMAMSAVTACRTFRT